MTDDPRRATSRPREQNRRKCPLLSSIRPKAGLGGRETRPTGGNVIGKKEEKPSGVYYRSREMVCPLCETFTLNVTRDHYVGGKHSVWCSACGYEEAILGEKTV